MSTKLFGTDGIRSRAGDFPLNAPSIVAIGQAVGERLGGTVLVGQDTRVSSPWIFGLLQEGIRRTKAVIEDAGVIPTPGIALLVKTGHYAGGIMISASHNPFQDNGVKLFSSTGTKLGDSDEAEIERRVAELQAPGVEEQRDIIPDVHVTGDNTTGFPARYSDLLESHFKGSLPGQWLKGLRIVMDCANGAMCGIAPRLLEKLGAKVNVIHASPTGRNINVDCGAVHLRSLTETINREGGDFAVAFDGDGDRALFVSGSGRRIDGDAVLLVLARRMRPAAVVGTSMTNYALEQRLKSEGIPLTRVDVGDRYIFEAMHRANSVKSNGSADGMLGGEPSGHIIFPDFGLSGDGLLTALKLAEAMVISKASLDELTSDWIPAPHLLKGIRVERRVPLDQLPELKQKIEDAERVLTGCGRVVVRYSGTEPLLRIMVESNDSGLNDRLMEGLIESLRHSILKNPELNQIQG